MEAEFSDDVRKTMQEVLSAGGFATLEAAAWEVSLTVALAKVSQYARECQNFCHTYGEALESFRARVERTTGSEDFTVEDDLADWEFAEQALRLWQQWVKVLRRAAV